MHILIYARTNAKLTRSRLCWYVYIQKNIAFVKKKKHSNFTPFFAFLSQAKCTPTFLKYIVILAVEFFS